MLTPSMFEVLKAQYLEQAWTGIIPNFSNFDGAGFKTLAYGAVLPDDNGTVWQWENEKAVAKKFVESNGVEYVEVKIPVRFAFNSINKGVMSTYAFRQYYFVTGPSGEWLIEGIMWSPADQRSSTDSASLLTAKSPIEDM